MLPQLSSYLPSKPLDVSSSGVTTTDTDGNSRMPTKKRRNSIEGAFSALSPRLPSPRRYLDSKRKQVLSGGSHDFESEGKQGVPQLRLDHNYHYQGHSFSSAEQLPSSYSQGGITPSIDATTTVYLANDHIQPVTPRRERTSRYLSEGDRREIITRIDNGEKQVTLAREFSVSRAAICNLYKNRWEVLTRGSRDPGSKHPKKMRGKRASPQQAPLATPTDGDVAAVSPYPDVSTISINSDQSDHGDAPAEREPWNETETPRGTPWLGWPGVSADQVHQVEHERVGETNQPAHEKHPEDNESALQQGDQQTISSSPVASKSFLVHEASAYSYPCRNLVASLRDVNASTLIFQQRSMRLIRLLIEEVLACLPHQDVQIKNEYGDICHATKSLDESDICALSMEDKGMVLLRAFSDICPTSSTGVISVETSREQATSNTVSSRQIRSQLPCIRPQQAVLLFDIQCATGEEACAVLHHLVHDKGVSEKSVYFVTVISSFEGLQTVFRQFPDVTLITAQVDTVVDQQQHIRPGIGDFVQRYWNLHTCPSDP